MQTRQALCVVQNEVGSASLNLNLCCSVKSQTPNKKKKKICNLVRILKVNENVTNIKIILDGTQEKLALITAF